MAKVCAFHFSFVDPLALTLPSGSSPSSAEAGFSSTGSAANKPSKSAYMMVDKPYSDSSSHIPLTNTPMNRLALTLDRDNSSLLQLTNAATFDGESEPMFGARTPNHTPVASSRSTPGLSMQPTTSLSNAILNNETVVHRPRLSARPTVNSSHFNQQKDNQHTTLPPKTPMSEAPSLQSSIFSPGSSVGPLSQSTAPTSLVSSGGVRSAETTLRNHNGRFVTDNSPSPFCEPIAENSPSRFLVFPRQDAPRVCEPSVQTIEKAVAVKVFFESHFNELLSTKTTPRSMRRRQMERKLLTMTPSEEQRQNKRRE